MIRFFNSSSEEFTAPPPTSALQEEPVDGTGGVAWRIALAASLVAISLATRASISTAQEPEPSVVNSDVEEYHLPPVVQRDGTRWTVFIDDQEPAGSLRGQPDEDFWANPAPPIPLLMRPPVPWIFEQHEQAVLFGQPDEDFWINSVAPRPLTFLPLPLWAAEQNEQAVLWGQPDEDFWINPVRPRESLQQPTPLWSFEQNEVGVQLFQVVEDEYWINPVAPVPLVFLAPKPWSFEQNEQAVLFGQPDEDFWINPVAPKAFILAPPNPWSFDQSETGVLFGQPDEDFWANPTAPVSGSIKPPAPWVFEQNEQAVLFGQPDEDFWINPVAPAKLTFTPLPLWSSEQNERPAQSGEVLPPDEDFWINPVRPEAFKYLPPSPWIFEQHEQAVLFGQPEEDGWPRTTVWSVGGLPLISQDSEFVYSPIEESEWSAFRPGDAPNRISTFLEEEYWPQINFEDEYWINPVRPAPFLFKPLDQSALEQHEPAGSLFGAPEESEWVPPILPRSSSVARAFSDTEEFIPVIEEQDLWSPRIQKETWTTPSILQDESVGFILSVEDEYWNNPVRPVPLLLLGLPIWSLDQNERIPASTELAPPDEDFWKNPAAPIPFTERRFDSWTLEQHENAVLFGQAETTEWTQVVRREKYLATLFTLNDETIIPTFPPENEYWLPPLTAEAGFAILQVLGGDGMAVQPTIVEDSDFWEPPLPPIPGEAILWIFSEEGSAGIIIVPPGEGWTWDKLDGKGTTLALDKLSTILDLDNDSTSIDFDGELIMKSNETLNLGGTLGGENLPANWVGASAVLTIWEQQTKRKILDKVPVLLDPSTKHWTYTSLTKKLAKGRYEVEILVTFAGGGQRAFPNGYYQVLDVLAGENT
jgi:hypothetical protein